jgi:hypothetical protein
VLEVIDQQVAAAGAELEGVTKDQMFPPCKLWDSIGEPDWIGIPKFADGMKAARQNLAYPEDEREDPPSDNLLRTVEEIAFHMGYMQVWNAGKVTA